MSKGLLDPSFLVAQQQETPTSIDQPEKEGSTSTTPAGDEANQNPSASSPTTAPAAESNSTKDDELENLLESAMRMQGTASLWELKRLFEVKIVGLSGVKWTEEDPSTQTFVQAAL